MSTYGVYSEDELNLELSALGDLSQSLIKSLGQVGVLESFNPTFYLERNQDRHSFSHIMINQKKSNKVTTR